MREIDLLPRWYVDLNRRKSALRLQACCAAVGLCLILAWTLTSARQIRSRHAVLEEKRTALAVSEQRVRQRTIQQQLRDQLRDQDRVESSLGLNVESSRLLELISRALPDSASLTDLSMETDERARPLLQQAVSTSALPAVPDRRLQVTLKCVAPANIDVATLLENLTDSGLCQNIRLDYAKEMTVDNTVMREFEIAFQINLNSEGAAQ